MSAGILTIKNPILVSILQSVIADIVVVPFVEFEQILDIILVLSYLILKKIFLLEIKKIFQSRC